MTIPPDLPADARTLVTAIEACMHDAEPLLRGGAHDVDGFVLAEMRGRYLPETLQIYCAVPPSLRDETDAAGESAHSRLLASLGVLVNAARTHLERLAAKQQDAVTVNSQFLADRFSDLPLRDPSTLIAEAAVQPALRTALQEVLLDTVDDTRRLLEIAAEHFERLCPALTSVTRHLFTKAVKRIQVEVPTANGAVRYLLTAVKTGYEAAVARVVHAVVIKTEVVSADIWIDAITEHLEEFARRNNDAATRLHDFGPR